MIRLPSNIALAIIIIFHSYQFSNFVATIPKMKVAIYKLVRKIVNVLWYNITLEFDVTREQA